MASQLDALHDASTTITAGDNQLKRISSLIAEEHEANCEAETAERLLSQAKQRRYDLRRNRIPEAMLDAGMAEFKTEEGVTAKLVFDTDGSLGSPRTAEEFAERRAKLMAIIEHGGGEVVKNIITIELPKGAEQAAEEIQRRIDKLLTTKVWTKLLGGNARVFRDLSANHQSLMAWIRERMGEDDATHRLPTTLLDRIGVWYGQVAKIKRPKEKKDG